MSTVPPASRRCTGPCGRVLPPDEFYPNRCNRCKRCTLDYKNAHRRAAKAAARDAVFAHYGRACACCAATERLTIDHVNGDGAEHRAELYGNQTEAAGGRFYLWLVAQGFPDGYQTLCDSCNKSKGSGSACRLDHATFVPRSRRGLTGVSAAPTAGAAGGG